MALVVSGQVRHRQLQPSDVGRALQALIPGLVTASPEFSASRNVCQLSFFCNNTSTLDFSITLPTASGSAPTAVAVLVREADALVDSLVRSLSKFGRTASVRYCVLEDERTRNKLLAWERRQPLKSKAAGVSYAICIAILLIGFFFIMGQLSQPQSETRDYNILSLALAVGLPALAVPLPFIFEHFNSKDAGTWQFAR